MRPPAIVDRSKTNAGGLENIGWQWSQEFPSCCFTIASYLNPEPFMQHWVNIIHKRADLIKDIKRNARFREGSLGKGQC